MKSLLVAILIFGLSGCATGAKSWNQDISVNADLFMKAYARELLQGDRAALAKLYHPKGSYFLGNGQKSLQSHESILVNYRDRWQPPSKFEWDELSFEPIGDTSVLVLGKFKWGDSADSEVQLYSYSALLVLVDGQFRIRSEDESIACKETK